MAQMIITAAFETLKAQRELVGLPIILDKFVLANVPEQDPHTPIDRDEGLPPAAQIVYQSDVTQAGFVNPNAVIYSLIMDTTVGDFDFNWIGLVNKESGVVAAISHIPTINKIKSVPGVQNGNSVTRSMMMSYIGAQSATGITVNASTWQIDFTARLMGTDEAERLANIDHYGNAAFLDTGYQVFKSGSSYKVKAGTGYVGGLRCHQTAESVVNNVKPSTGIYLDASWQGGLTSAWQTVVALKVSAQALTDFSDSNGVAHYVTKVADIDSSGNVIDRRTLGGTPAFERKDNSATNADIDSGSSNAKHVKLPQLWRAISKKITAALNNRTIATTGALQGGGTLGANRTLSIKDATTGQKGAVQLEDSVTSTSTTKAATSNSVRLANNRAIAAENNAKAHADNRVSELLGGAPVDALDTIKELGEALQDNDSDIAAINATIATKASKSDLDAHKNNHSNPHDVDKNDVGLGYVNNWSATSAVNDASNSKYATAKAAKTAFDKAVSAINVATSKWTPVNASLTAKGISQLTNAVNSSSETLAATAKAVKTAYDKGASAYSLAASKWTHRSATTSQTGTTQLSTSTTSNSTSLAATPSAVKAAMDKAKEALNQAGSSGGKVKIVAVNSNNNIGTNQRHVIKLSTLGADWVGKQIIVRAEVYYNGKWGDPGYAQQGSRSASYGTKASQLGDEVIIQTGSYQVMNTSSWTGNPFKFTGELSSAKCRIVCWMVG